MVRLTHTKTCIDRTEARARSIDRWKARWPEHCRGCLARTNGENPCLSCLYGLKCPRCGKDAALHPEDATLPCTFCGWRDSYDMPDGCPEDYVCTCRVAQAHHAERERDRLYAERQRIDAEIDKLQRQRDKLR